MYLVTGTQRRVSVCPEGWSSAMVIVHTSPAEMSLS